MQLNITVHTNNIFWSNDLNLYAIVFFSYQSHSTHCATSLAFYEQRHLWSPFKGFVGAKVGD